jgi:hypothetical protein
MSKEPPMTQTELDQFDQQAQSDGQQMKNTSDGFMKDAPPLKFDLPFGLGKLFGLPGAKENAARRKAAKAAKKKGDAS